MIGEMHMSREVIFMGWDRPATGRERLSGDLFQEVLEYLGRLQGAGKIDSFETVLLGPHGGDLNGFMLLRGDRDQLNALQASEEWQTYLTRGGIYLEGFGAVRGVTGEGVMEWMALWTEVMPA
jgi:hypothetical protein